MSAENFEEDVEDEKDAEELVLVVVDCDIDWSRIRYTKYETHLCQIIIRVALAVSPITILPSSSSM